MTNIIQNNLAPKESVFFADVTNEFGFISDDRYKNLQAIFSPRYALWQNITGLPRVVNLVNGSLSTAESSFSVSDNLIKPLGNHLTIAPKINFNPNSWSYFVVTKPANTSNTKHLINTRLQQTGVTAVRIAITGSGKNLLVYRNSDRSGGQPIRLRWDSDFSSRPEPSILFVTFSTSDGLKIFDNGSLVESEPADKDPLDFGYFGHQLVCFGEGGQTDNEYGEFGLFDEDISLVGGLVQDLYQNLLALR